MKPKYATRADASLWEFLNIVLFSKPKITAHNTASGREVEVPRVGIHQWGKTSEQEDWHTDSWSEPGPSEVYRSAVTTREHSNKKHSL